MTQRITRAFVEARINTVNRLLNIPSANPNAYDAYTVAYSTVGAVYLSGAYGGWAVYQWVDHAGGATDLSKHGYGTLREASTFLAGMIAGLRQTQAQDATATRVERS